MGRNFTVSKEQNKLARSKEQCRKALCALDLYGFAFIEIGVWSCFAEKSQQGATQGARSNVGRYCVPWIYIASPLLRLECGVVLHVHSPVRPFFMHC